MRRVCQVNLPEPQSLVIIYVRAAIDYQQCVLYSTEGNL